MSERMEIDDLWIDVVGHPPETPRERALYEYARAGEAAGHDTLPLVLSDGSVVLSPKDQEGTRFALRRIMGFGSDPNYVGKLDFEGVARHALDEGATNAERARFAQALQRIVLNPEEQPG